jgi:hypothetical protein
MGSKERSVYMALALIGLPALFKVRHSNLIAWPFNAMQGR